MQTANLNSLSTWLSPQGQLRLVADPDAAPLAAVLAALPEL